MMFSRRGGARIKTSAAGFKLPRLLDGGPRMTLELASDGWSRRVTRWCIWENVLCGSRLMDLPLRLLWHMDQEQGGHLVLGSHFAV